MYGLKFLAVHKTFTTEEADRDSVAPVVWELSLPGQSDVRTNALLEAPGMTFEVAPRTGETAGRAYVVDFKDS